MSRAPPKPSPNNASSSNQPNEYIPNFISRKPFYVDSTLSDADYLEHQRLQSQPQDTLANSKWYERGRKLGPAATKFRKGACENCGAMTHKTKDCLSRPRKQGAKWSGRDIQADEVVEDVKLGWDAKRDRWNGYDAREYSEVVKEYEELEALKKAAAGGNGQKQLEEGNGTEDGDPEIESAKYAEETDMGRNQPTSTRNLRIREDTAKYLLNLDLDSAKYDPKTRSMADVGNLTTNTDADSNNAASALVADENFMRSSGDAAEFEKAQRYAWETQERGVPGGQKLHLQANPTEGEILRKKQTLEATSKKEANRKTLLEKYGGAEHLQPAPFRAAENERYVEYDERGGVKGEVRQIASSKYREDLFVNNHTEVWGSWWTNFQWGYACCHSTVKNSYCTGDEGRRAFEAAQRIQIGHLLIEDRKEDAKAEADAKAEQDAAPPGVKLQPDAEMDKPRQQSSRTHPDTAEELNRTSTSRAKKRTLQEMREGITEEEMEDFKRNRAAADDPMAKFLGRDELVH